MSCEYDKMIAGKMYVPWDSELVNMRKRARLLCEAINQLSINDNEKRVHLIKELLGSTGESIYIEPNFRVDYGCNIHVGEHFYANYDCIILDAAPVTIGKNCLLAPRVGLYTATHPIDVVERTNGIEYGKPITIGDNCWIGGNAIINPGVTLGNNVVVASGSVVTKSFGDNVVIGGNPARILKIMDIKEASS